MAFNKNFVRLNSLGRKVERSYSHNCFCSLIGAAQQATFLISLSSIVHIPWNYNFYFFLLLRACSTGNTIDCQTDGKGFKLGENR